jgi:DNA-binding transcriptional regulator/RsmH inhibitor MraZ
MADITNEELEKAARNIERISAFIGERRDWIVGEGGEEQANVIRDHAKTLATMLAESTGTQPDSDFKITLPSKLEPSAKISATRLSKFADFLGQLQTWLDSQNEVAVPEDAEDAVQKVYGSLTLVCAAVDSLLRPPVAEEPPPPKPDDLVGEIDDLPVLEVDLNARLVLENHELKPLLQTFQGVTELTVHTKKILEDFLAEQNVTIEGHELRRLHDKMLKWIEGTPQNQTLVVKLSGLSGKPNVYSSYQPKGGIPAKKSQDD